MKVCHIIGLQRSGTNFCQELITDNFSNVSVIGNNCEDYIWKHSSEVKFLKLPDYLVYVYKHPLMWVESAIVSTVTDFLDKLPFSSEDPKVNNISLKCLVDLYNTNLNSWVINYNNILPIVYVKYENLLLDSDIEIFFKELQNKFNFNRCTKKIYKSNLGETHMSQGYYPENHLNKYLELKCNILSKQEQEYILNNIDEKILKLYGT